ncbi:MAG TPA: ABC transporter ATP-binding protein [Candidatus Baltobacteraceae bacterium]|nr:ABC transporter ATP-binding protein [Candidatus Baltobacteraceae bacterium]
MNAESRNPLLQVRDLRAGYGRIEILHGVSFDLRADSLCTIIGANGAGKTTLLLALSRILSIRSGSVRLDGVEISRKPSHAIVRAGMIHVPEGRRMLAGMSVHENLLVAAGAHRLRDTHAEIDAIFERFPILAQRRTLAAGSLSGGEQQMLAIARALIVHPKVLLLDEPSMGLSPKLVDQIFEIIVSERVRGTAILLVEQNARRALEIADEAHVLERGTITLSGPASELIGREEITAAYLGTPP